MNSYISLVFLAHGVTFIYQMCYGINGDKYICQNLGVVIPLCVYRSPVALSCTIFNISGTESPRKTLQER